MSAKMTKEPAMPPITELLHADHQKVKDLFFKFKEAEKGAEKEKIVEKILMELFVHSTVEEELVYSHVKKVKEGGELVDEANTEHRIVKFLMAELSEMSSKDELFDAKVTVLCELVNHHIGEEEKEMFKKLHDSGMDLEKISQRVMKRKEELMLQPLPKMDASLHIGKAKKGGRALRKTA
jgi:hypothetical protein